ncbi:hypothetical protein PFLmoz3_01994 [Pseudomonas fluorescens]|uniref:Uncharacterized protein n=1 Tax=Pseudomonas fluorescens TaxID=294 RepID=A0A109LKF3_PSEFL|nr:hypothetical protein PFLmoz3_01994 [Pseudomonas fluorescens]
MPGGGICRAHQPVDHPGLATDFGGEPTSKNRNQPRRAHPQRQVQERFGRVHFVAPAQPQAEQTGEDHQEPQADHDPERPEHNGGVGTVLRRELLERRHLLVQGVSQDQAAQVRNLDRVFGFLGFHVRPTEQNQRRGLVADIFPVAFNRGDLGRLMLEGIEAVEVADHRLDGRNDQGHPHRHREHFADRRGVLAAQ